MNKYVQSTIREYIIVLFINKKKHLLNLHLRDKKNNRKAYINTYIKFKGSLKKNFSNVEDFIEQINEGKNVILDLKEVYCNEANNKQIKYLILIISKKLNNELINLVSKKIKPFNVI